MPTAMRSSRSFRVRSLLSACALSLGLGAGSARADVKVGDPAPNFTLKTQDNQPFTLESRKGKGWTVLYFYPKAETPGCTHQACAFRDAVKVIRAKNAEVYGISADTVEDQKKFHEHHQLTFDLLADPDDVAIKAFDAKMPVVGMAKRWTFILDPQLIVRYVDQNVDPVLDAQHSATKLDELQKSDVKGKAAPSAKGA